GYTGLQWQVSTNGGGTWSDISVGDPQYLGVITNQLSMVNAPVTLNGNQYRLAIIGACTTVNTNAVTLTVNPNPVVSFAADITACGGVPVVMNGNPTGGTAPYAQHRWTGDVGPLSNYTIQSPTFNSQIAGTYNLNYKVTDSKGCTANNNIAVVVDSPSADFNQDVNNGCTPLSVAFSKDMTGIAKYWWDFNDGSPVDSATTNPAHLFTNSNATSIEYRNVKLTVRSPGGCLDTFTAMVTVYPAINATFTASTDIVCSGSPINFSTLSGASKYFWEYGDGVSGYGLNTSSHTYTNFTTAPVVLQVKLTTTSFYSCEDVKTINITVMPVPLAQFSAVPPSQVYNVAGNQVSFTNETNAGTWSWLWNFGDGATQTIQNPSHTYTALGDYDVSLVVSNANCTDSIKHTVSVLPQAPVASFDPIESGCEPLNISISNTSLNTETPGTSYRWDFGDGSISTAKNPTYTYFDPGTYRVELTVTGPGGTSTVSQVVNSYPSPKSYFEVTPLFVFVNDEKVRGFNLSQGADTYLWEFGDGDTSKLKEPFHKYMEAGVFDITLWAYKNNGNIVCSDKYVLSPGVTVEPAGEVRFSTVFTPNKDGPIERTDLPTGGTEIDQFFFPPIREKVINYKLQIFNRLGVLIFQSNDINTPWNGYYKGKLCPQGVYIWYVEGKYANGQPFKKVGDVTLLH
ncbi:MAG: PKD domain-containing protein, partial [Bacteroidetes bacterium]